MKPTARHRELARIAAEAVRGCVILDDGAVEDVAPLIAEAFARELGPIKKGRVVSLTIDGYKSWAVYPHADGYDDGPVLIMRAPKRRGK